MQPHHVWHDSNSMNKWNICLMHPNTWWLLLYRGHFRTHASTMAMLSLHPLNPTPRCWNASVGNKKKIPGVWFCWEPYFVFMTFKQRQAVFNATHIALNQQSWTSEVSPVEAQKRGIGIPLSPIRFKIFQNTNSRENVTVSNTWCMQNPASTEEKSRFSFG